MLSVEGPHEKLPTATTGRRPASCSRRRATSRGWRGSCRRRRGLGAETAVVHQVRVDLPVLAQPVRRLEAGPVLAYLRTGLEAGMRLPDPTDPDLETVRIVAEGAVK